MRSSTEKPGERADRKPPACHRTYRNIPDMRSARSAPEAPKPRSAPRGKPLNRRSAAGAGLALALLLSACSLSRNPVPLASVRASTPATNPTEPAAPGPWHSVFDARFTGSTLDPNTWVTCYDWNNAGCTIATNNELEWYQPGQVSVGDGMLTLTAQRRSVTTSTGVSLPWVSGMISTGRSSWNDTPRHTFTYGYFLADIELTPATGMYPAFWLLPADHSFPPEVDIMESAYPHDKIQLNVHYTQAGRIQQAQYYTPAGHFTDGFHTYALDWEPTRLTWYIDGTPVYMVSNPAAIPHTAMEILIDLAVGLPSPPAADVSTATVHVKDVQVWQH
jgi:beta-glucanase (GH16 family)